MSSLLDKIKKNGNCCYLFIKHELDENVKGITCEIGVDNGYSSVDIMKGMLERNMPRVHISIDPFGGIPYRHYENIVDILDYDNIKKIKTRHKLAKWCEENKYENIFFEMEDTEFFKRFSDGVPYYKKDKYLLNQYAFVHYDGPHNVKDVKIEIDFFKNKTPIGGIWVFDDIEQYPHMQQLDPYIRSLGFTSIIKEKIILNGREAIGYKRTSLAGINLVDDVKITYQLPENCVFRNKFQNNLLFNGNIINV